MTSQVRMETTQSLWTYSFFKRSLRASLMQDAILRPTMCEETKQKWFLLSWHSIFDIFILFLLDIIYLGGCFPLFQHNSIHRLFLK